MKPHYKIDEIVLEGFEGLDTRTLGQLVNQQLTSLSQTAGPFSQNSVDLAQLDVTVNATDSPNMIAQAIAAEIYRNAGY